MVKRRTVLSMEQALSLSYATLRFVQLGWRVIRLEATTSGDLPGDPNRYIGEMVADADRRSYFIAPNVGKEAIALNLKEPAGRDILKQLIQTLDIDVFCCNTLPGRYEALGIDYPTLKSYKPDIIWAGISAMGPDYPFVPGYDPALQAMSGYMEVTGEADGPPTLSGVPIIDFKAGDEVYAGVCLALLEKMETGLGQAIHISMLQAAASWLTTTLPLLDFDCDPAEVTRCGNEHRKFIPVNTYPTADGYILIAIGNDVQWQRLVSLEKFAALTNDQRKTNQGRHQERAQIHADMRNVTQQYATQILIADLLANKIPHAQVQTIVQVKKMPAIQGKLTTTALPNGKIIQLPPMAVDIPQAATHYKLAPKYSEQTRGILQEIGVHENEIQQLVKQHIIPSA